MDGSAGVQRRTQVLAGSDRAFCRTRLRRHRYAYKAALHQEGQRGACAPEGKIDRAAFSANQHLAHGYGWVVTYLETLRETANWASRLEGEGKFGEIDALLAQILFSKYLADLVGWRADEPGRDDPPA